MSIDPDHKGVLQVQSGTTVLATLAEGATGGGRLMLFSSTHETMVEAGVDAGGYGVVRAGPESFKPGFGLLGLPGSYLTGKPE